MIGNDVSDEEAILALRAEIRKRLRRGLWATRRLWRFAAMLTEALVHQGQAADDQYRVTGTPRQQFLRAVARLWRRYKATRTKQRPVLA